MDSLQKLFEETVLTRIELPLGTDKTEAGEYTDTMTEVLYMCFLSGLKTTMFSELRAEVIGGFIHWKAFQYLIDSKELFRCEIVSAENNIGKVSLYQQKPIVGEVTLDDNIRQSDILSAYIDDVNIGDTDLFSTSFNKPEYTKKDYDSLATTTLRLMAELSHLRTKYREMETDYGRLKRQQARREGRVTTID